MAGASKRAGGNGKHRIWYTDESGRRKFATGFPDRKESLKLAREKERQCRLVREGLVDPKHFTARAAAGADLGHLIGLWRQSIVDRGKTEKHARHQARDAGAVLNAAGIASVADLDPDRVSAAVAKLTVPGKGGAPLPASARTRNHALAAVKAFARWLDATGRISEYPRAWRDRNRGDKANEAADRRRRRRALTPEEIARLLAATAAGPDRVLYGHTRRRTAPVRVGGPARALLYRVALGTGFRANELRSLTPESFDLDADPPRVTVTAGYAKNGKTAVQPIRRELAGAVRAWLAAGNPLPPVPEKLGDWVKADLKLAGIPYETPDGVVDGHALRHSFISNLVARGVSVKQAQALARHSTPALTLGVYSHVTTEELGKVLEGE